MSNPGPGDWPPSQPSVGRLREVPVRGPDPAGQPPYYLNGYEHEEAPAGVKPGTGDPWDGFTPTEPRRRRPYDAAATGTRTLWIIALAFAALMTFILAVR